MQYSELSDEVLKGRGKVPVADYKIVDYVDGNNSSVTTKRSCYSFCMCPGGQVKFSFLVACIEIILNNMKYNYFMLYCTAFLVTANIVS